MNEIFNDQQSVNIVLVFLGCVIILILLKISIVQDSIKDEVDDIFKSNVKTN